jgi:hypothetical protein
MKRSILVWVVVIAVCSLSACSTKTGGTATPSPTDSGTATSAPSDPNVPKVSAPLDPSAYLADPCKVVPESLMTELGFTKPGKPNVNTTTSKAGPSCAWLAGAKGNTVAILTGNRDRGAGGLVALYASKGTLFAFVEPAPDVEGYPAAYAQLKDNRSAGECGIFVGIADDLVFDVHNTGYQGEQDSCDAAQKVAAAVVKTLKGA